jgi:hypothetical protein
VTPHVRPSPKLGVFLMIRAVISLTLLLSVLQPASASPGKRGALCIARVLKSEVTAYAPLGYWLVRVTYEIAPPGGPASEGLLQGTMPWQGAPSREGEAFRLRCDRRLHLDFVKTEL